MSALGCPECGHPIGTHSHDVGCMDPTTDGRRLERNQLGFCPCERSSLDLIAGAVAAAGADALREAAVDWQEGEWANAPRHADRIQERIANGQFVSDWLRQRAAEVPPDHAAVPCPAPPTERTPVFIPRALRCACTDAHHYRGSALCPLTPVDPWGVDGETP